MITAHQRLSSVQPSITDLGTFGCMAVALKPPPHRTKSELSSRGWVGKYLGRSLGGKTGQWDVLTEGNLVHNSSVQIDEEHLPWRTQGAKVPLRPTARARRRRAATCEPGGARSFDCMFNLFSGPYSRAEGLSQRLKQQFGWKTVINIDNDPDSSGGWTHDLLNDETYAKILALAARGAFDSIMIAWPCSTFSASRFFTDDPPGPSPVRTKTYPDGLPEAEIDPKHLPSRTQEYQHSSRTLRPHRCRRPQLAQKDHHHRREPSRPQHPGHATVRRRHQGARLTIRHLDV